MSQTIVLAVALSLISTASVATTLTDSLAVWRAGVGAASVTSTATTGLFDPSALDLPTASTIPLGDGSSLGVSIIVQVQQPQSGFPYLLADGFSGDLFMPQDALGNGVQTETITPRAGITALGFEVLPFSSSLGGPYTVTVLAAGQTLSASLPGGDFNSGTSMSAFFGYFGGAVGSFTLTTTDPNGFAIGDFVDVPEPASLVLLGLGAAGLIGFRRRA